MAQQISFTKRKIDNLPLPAKGKRAYYQDSKLDQLLLQVTSSGSKSFQVYKWARSKPVRVTLGPYPDVTFEQARKQAFIVLAQIADGIDPNKKKKADKARAITLSKAFDDYIANRGLKPSTVKDYQRSMKGLDDWKAKPITQITRDMVERRHLLLGKRSCARANLTMRVLRAVLNYAAGKYEDENGHPILLDVPTKRLSVTRQWFRIERRRGIVKPHQLKPWFDAVMNLSGERSTAKAAVVQDYLLFILFAGTRREETARLRWADIDFDARTFIIHDPKNRVPHELPMSDFLLDLLRKRKKASQSEWVFDGKSGHIVEPNRWLKKVIEVSGVAFTLHDLRRTFITIAESLDISSYALKALLNHKSGNSDVTQGYLIIDSERLRGPMQQITDCLFRHIHEANVVELQRTTG